MYFLREIVQDEVKAFTQKLNGAKIKCLVLKFYSLNHFRKLNWMACLIHNGTRFLKPVLFEQNWRSFSSCIPSKTGGSLKNCLAVLCSKDNEVIWEKKMKPQ